MVDERSESAVIKLVMRLLEPVAAWLPTGAGCQT
jgi:hypothetical protein